MNDFKVYRYPKEAYQEVDRSKVRFDDKICVAYAVCSKECGHTEFLVDGSSQNCKVCGKQLFRTAIYEYRLDDDAFLGDRELFNEKFPLNVYNIGQDGFPINGTDIDFVGDDGYELEEYIEVDDKTVDFPEYLYIGFSVSSKECKAYEYTAENSSQICEYCGKQLLCICAERYKRWKRMIWNEKTNKWSYAD